MSDHIINSRWFRLKECGKCGIEFLMPTLFDDECKKEGKNKTWYCPNGHGRIYSENEADKLRRERDLLKQQLAQKDDEIAQQRRAKEEAEKQASAARGQVTKLRNRAKAGLCPCCNRHFTNLERHMASKHTDVKIEAVAS